MGDRVERSAHVSSAALAGLLLSSIAMILSIAAFSSCAHAQVPSQQSARTVPKPSTESPVQGD